MAYASITYTSASGTTFALTNSSGDPIEYLRQNDISVTVNGVLKTLTTDYTFNTAGTAIILNTAVSGATVIIARTTDIADATVSFTAGSTLTAQDLNNSDKQNRFALQEFSDIYGALTTGTGDLSALGGFIGSAETWLSDNAHAPTTGAVDTRVDSKIDTALTTDVVAGDSITVTDNSPSSGQITIGVTNASISTAKLVDSSVTTAKIADGNVTTAKILDANVTTAKILDANVTTAKIADNAVTSAKIADGTIVAADLASDSVTTAKILDSNVTTGKINDLAVTTAKLADSSVTSAKIVDGTIVAGDLASDSVTTAKIVDSNVTTAKINDSAVTTGKIADSAVTAIKIADGVITSAKLNAATVVTAAEQAACTPDDVTFFTTSASDGRYVNVTGDSMTGALAMGSNKITGLGTPTANADAATKLYVDNSVAAGVGDADYGDITVSGTGTVWTIDSGVVTSAKIADGTIVNGDINASAAIAGTKISPDFGSQTIATTGIVSHALGTAAAPTVTFTGDTNTGIYSPGADQVAISTGGSGRIVVGSTGTVNIVGAGTAGSTQAVSFNGSAPVNSMVLDSSGQLGIGITSPRNTLDINGGVILASGSNLTWGNVYGAGIPTIAGSSGTLRFYPNGSTSNESVRIDSSGRLLVGTSSSSVNTSLVLNGSSSGAGTPANVYLQRNETAPAVDAALGQLFFANDAGNTAASIRSLRDAGTWTTGSSHPGRLVFSTTADGAPSPTERLRITSAGLVGIGNTEPGSYATNFNDLVVGNHTGNHGITIASQNTTTGRILFADGTGATEVDVGEILYNHANNSLSISTNRSTAVTIDSSGRLLVGTSSDTSLGEAGALIQAAYSGGSLMSVGRSDTTVTNNEFIGGIDFATQSGTGSTWQRSARILCYADANQGNGDSPGRLTFSTTADGASSPTERMRITSGGEILVGTTTVFSASSSTATGNILHPDGYAVYFASGQQCLYLGRQTSDGSIVSIRQAGVEEGSISVSGTTVSYNGAHLSRWSQLPSGAERTEILRGTVLSNLDEMCEWIDEENEQLNRMKVSDVEGDKNVSGVFQAWDDDDDTYINDFYCAMTGDFIIRIAEGVTVERGDLLMSAGDGTAKPQDDDIIRSKTIAKVTSTNVSCTYEDGSYCVPCVLMAC